MERLKKAAAYTLEALKAAGADDAQVNEIHVYKLDRVRGTSPTTTVAIEWEE